MSEPGIQSALRESVVEVLEKMFFISAFEESPNQPTFFRPCLTAQLEFEGDPPGSMAIRTTSLAARSIAADFLGEEPESLSSAQVEEVVCELANMICGAVLSRVESQAVFRLGSPRIVRVDATPALPAGGSPAIGPVVAGTTVRLAEIGDSALVVTMHVERPPCTVTEKYAF